VNARRRCVRAHELSGLREVRHRPPLLLPGVHRQFMRLARPNRVIASREQGSPGLAFYGVRACGRRGDCAVGRDSAGGAGMLVDSDAASSGHRGGAAARRSSRRTSVRGRAGGYPATVSYLSRRDPTASAAAQIGWGRRFWPRGGRAARQGDSATGCADFVAWSGRGRFNR
jgi:hypothetical protein